MSTTTMARRAASGDGTRAAIETVHEAEVRLLRALEHLSDQHATDHEIHHVARDLAAWSREHIRRLAMAGQAHGLDLDTDLDAEAGHKQELAGALKRAGAGLPGRRPEPAILLLSDLCDLHLRTAEVSLDWEILAQVAQATKDADLRQLTSACHAQTLRQLRWSNTHVKDLADQALTAQ
jgi:hypothetical protein